MSGSEIHIRPAEADDLGRIVEIWWHMLREHDQRDPTYWGLREEAHCRRLYGDFKLQLFEDEDHIHLVAVIDGEVAGFIHGEILERPELFRRRFFGRIDEVAVHPDHRGRGVGKAMVPAIEAEFKKIGLFDFDLMVDAGNPVAAELYKSLGYRVREFHLVKNEKS